MHKESTVEIFQKIKKYSDFFDTARAAGDRAKAHQYAEQCTRLYQILATKVPLREHEYLRHAKEWKTKLEGVQAIPAPAETAAADKKTSASSPHAAFISYSHPDRMIAYSLCSFLESEGIRCWIAPRDILPGSHYSASIIEGIDKSRILILIFSKSSNCSSHVFRELEEALLKNIRILPFRIDDIPLSQDMRYFINIPHWLDAYRDKPETYFGELAGSVRAYLENTPK